MSKRINPEANCFLAVNLWNQKSFVVPKYSGATGIGWTLLFQKENIVKKKGVTKSEQVQNHKTHWSRAPACQTCWGGSPAPMALLDTATLQLSWVEVLCLCLYQSLASRSALPLGFCWAFPHRVPLQWPYLLSPSSLPETYAHSFRQLHLSKSKWK